MKVSSLCAYKGFLPAGLVRAFSGEKGGGAVPFRTVDHPGGPGVPQGTLWERGALQLVSVVCAAQVLATAPFPRFPFLP